VFDATLLLGLGGEQQEPLLAALMMFRVLYHLVPLCIALALFGSIEAGRRLRARAPIAGDGGNSNRRIELQADHADNDQREADDPHRIGRLAIEQHAEHNAANRADPRPYRIRGAKRQRP